MMTVSKTTIDQSLQLFQVSTTNRITKNVTNQNHNQRCKYHHLMKTLHLTLKMTSAQVVETSGTKNSLKDYYHPDDHNRQTKLYQTS